MFSDTIFDAISAILKSIRHDYAFAEIYPRAEVINMLTNMLALVNYSDGIRPEEKADDDWRAEMKTRARKQAEIWYDQRIVLSVDDEEPPMYETPTPTQPLHSAMPKFLDFNVRMSIKSETKSDDWELCSSALMAINTNIQIQGYEEKITSISIRRDDEEENIGDVDVVLADGSVFKYSWSLTDGAFVIELA